MLSKLCNQDVVSERLVFGDYSGVLRQDFEHPPSLESSPIAYPSYLAFVDSRDGTWDGGKNEDARQFRLMLLAKDDADPISVFVDV